MDRQGINMNRKIGFKNISAIVQSCNKRDREVFALMYTDWGKIAVDRQMIRNY